ncbi:MAG: 4-hydroxy-tetrahydrodipicolinate reductase [Planctomycetes bacterium]|nr:4-hydroxy-tetrahydrodipicolinate reductase [Planctomycetota bacterium]
MNAKLPVAVIGASGRVGRLACALIAASSEFELVGAWSREDDWIGALRASGARVALEATVAGRGAVHGLALLEADVRPLIATSGVGVEDNERLDRVARERGLGGLVVPNFSLGSLLMQRFAAEAARHIARAEIIELHHADKVDAPSGTSLETARRIALARGERSETTPIHSVRLPGLYAHQEVIFGAAGESLTLRHDMSGPEAFAPGILAGLRYVARCSGVGRGLELALET